jgi:PAS domain S-box-containing protein
LSAAPIRQAFLSSLTFRIGIVIILVELLGLAASGAYYLDRFATAVDQRTLSRMNLIGQLMASGRLQYDLVRDRHEMAALAGEELLDAMVVGVNRKIFYALDPRAEGHAITEYGTIPASWFSPDMNVASTRRESTPEGNYLVSVTPIMVGRDQRPYFFVYLKLSGKRAAIEKRAIGAFFVGGSLGCLLLTSLGIIVSFRTMVSRRLLHTLGGIQRVEAGDLNARIDTGAARDEIQALQHGFNSMTAKLQERTWQREQAESALRESEFRFRSFFDSNPISVALMDRDGRLKTVNSALLQHTGYRREALIGRRLAEFLPAPQDPAAASTMALLQQGGGREALETEFIKGDGTRLPIALRGWILFDEKREAIGLGAFVHDLSREKKLLAEKTALEQQLQHTQKMEAIGTLAGGIAHDFNNILSGIIGYTELVISDLPVDQTDQHECLARVLKAGNRARDLVKQILQFSRREAGSSVPFALTPLIKEALKLLRSTLPPNVDIKTNLGAVNDRITADPGQMHQVVMNLLVNAYQALQNRSGTITVGLENMRLDEPCSFMSMSIAPGDYLVLNVADNGVGISRENLFRIFDPYFTTKSAAEGTGLGLSVTHGIVKNHMGLIKVESEAGRGSRFRVFLPVGEAISMPFPATAGIMPCGNGQRILVVDDEAFFLDVVAKQLARLNYQVQTFAASPAAWAYLQTHPVALDLLITDQNMPEMTGLILIEKLRAAGSGLPVILCTGFSEVVDESVKRRLQIEAILMKPISHSDLAAAVQHALLRSHRNGDHYEQAD